MNRACGRAALHIDVDREKENACLQRIHAFVGIRYCCASEYTVVGSTNPSPTTTWTCPRHHRPHSGPSITGHRQPDRPDANSPSPQRATGIRSTFSPNIKASPDQPAARRRAPQTKLSPARDHLSSVQLETISLRRSICRLHASTWSDAINRESRSSPCHRTLFARPTPLTHVLTRIDACLGRRLARRWAWQGRRQCHQAFTPADSQHLGPGL